MSCAFELEVNKIIEELSADDDDDSHNLDGPRPDPTSRRLDDRYDSDFSYTLKMAKASCLQASTVVRRILDADNSNTIERLVLAGYKQLSSPWRALVQRAQQVHQVQQVPDHTDITAPFLSLVLDRAGEAGEPGETELQRLRAYIKLVQHVHPFNKLRRDLDALSRSAQETEQEQEQEQEQELSEQELDIEATGAEAAPPRSPSNPI